MNIKNLLATVLLLLILPGGYQRVFATQLTGTYTIDAAGTATASSFLNVSSAISYLTGVGTRSDGGPANTAPFGVSGPVVFMIAPGTYTEQVTLKGMIDGASPVNTVTFEGTDPATRTISFAATASALRYTLKLDSTKYVSFRNLTIVANGATYGWAVHITNTNCIANKITHCTINITGNGATSASANYCGIVVSGSTTTATTGVSLDSLEIDSNTINAGLYGIITSGLSSYYQKANRIRYNKVYSSYTYGIYTTYQDGVAITNNIVIPRTGSASSSGILVMNSNSSVTATGNLISRNKVSNFGSYGIRISTVLNNYAGTKGEISNNMIGGGITGAASFPLNISSSNNWNVCHNTINHDVAATAVTNASLNISGGLNLNVYNNILAETKGGSGLPLYVSTLTAIDTIDYNIFYRSDTSNGQLIYIGGLYYNTGSFKRSGIADSNSIFLKPLFVNDTNLHLFNACNRGASLSYITTDIDGNLRGTPPVIGAHEAQPIADNIAIAAIVNPVHPIDTGTQDVVVRIRNVGSTTVTGFNITYILNGGTPVTQAWTGTLAACDTVSVVLTGSNSITLGIANYIKVYTGLPNGVADGNPIDDTLNLKYYYVLNGTYTVGGTGADFLSLGDARDALQQRGVAGPVTFMLNPGTYAGQLIISGQIAGASDTSAITFEGTDAATRTITASVASGATVILNQCNYVHFRNITISNTYAGSGTGFAFVGSNLSVNGSKNSIKHCVINMPNLNTASGIGIAVTGSANGFGTSNNRMDSLVIDSNTINGANTGISIYGNSGATSNYNHDFKVRGNTIVCTDAQSDQGIFINYVYNGTEANYNNVTATGGIGIYFATCPNNFPGSSSHQIIKNRLNIGNGGIQMDGCLTLATNPTKIYNNLIFVHSTVIATGIYVYAGGIDEIYHNTIQIDSTSSLFLGMCFNYDGSADSKVKNNIFAHSGSGTGTVYPVYIANGVAGDNLNYNVYYNAAGPDLVFRGGVAYGNANLLTDSTGGDSSYNLKPAFANNSDLHLTTGCPRGVDLTTWVTADLDDLPRSTSPSIGCYEFGGYGNDVEVQAITEPVMPVAVGPQDMRVLLANKGNNAITSFNITYELNGGAPVTQTWGGILPACDTVSIVFTGANQLNIANAINTLKVYTSMPNFTADGNPLNDTITKQIAPALNGNYVIGAAPSDFATFTDAASALALRGVSGRVVFDVKTATYAEAFTLPAIAGASAANTITFQSMAGHRDSVSLTFASTGSSVVNLQNASFVNLRNLSINQLANADYYSALLIGGTASYDSIENCELTVPPFVSNFTMALYTSALTGTGMVIRNNYVSGGYGGIMINILDAFLNPNIVTSNHIIENNIIENANYYSSFNFRVTNLILRNNTIIPDPTNTGHTGIHLESCDSAFLVSGNKVIGQSGGFGMYINACTGTPGVGGVISNNEISVGTANTAAEGIHVIVSSALRFYNNSINVISNAAVNTAAAYFSGSTDFIIRNNIFSNAGGPALYANAPYDFDYNNLYTTGINLAKYNATNYTSLAAWRTAVNTPDLHSVSYRPGFTSATNLEPNAADSASWSLNGRGIHLAANPTDIHNNIRPATIADGLPDLGAYEFTPAALPPLAVPDIALPVPGDTQVYVSVFAPKDTVATIYWDATNPFFPTTIAVRQYVGEKPPTIGTASYYMYFYTDMDCDGTGFYNYNIDVKYKDLWLGTMPNEADIRIARKVTDGPWVVDVSSNSQIDTAVNIMKTMFQSDSSAMFTGSDIFSPLPVKLLTISANKLGRNALISWTTASEANSSMFEIERSYDGKTFKPVGKVKAAGSSQSKINYQYTDLNPSSDLQFTKPIYYRLKMVDANAAYAYSQTVKVSWSNEIKEQVSVFPNPFVSEVFVSVETAAATDVKVEWMDITGKTLTSARYKVSGGTTMLDVLPEATMKAGIYFVSIDMNGTKQVYKVIKE